MAEVDERLLATLEVAEDIFSATQALNRQMKDGFMDMTEARFASKWNKISQSSFPQRIEPTIRVVLHKDSQSGLSEWRLVREANDNTTSPTVTASKAHTSSASKSSSAELRQRKNTKSGAHSNTSKDKGKGKVKSGPESKNESRQKKHSAMVQEKVLTPRDNPKRDPLKWFGLPPQSLRRAKAKFDVAFCQQIPKLASLMSKVRLCSDEFASLKGTATDQTVDVAGADVVEEKEDK